MGTRADFYFGRGEDAEWLGSIAWDGYPSGIDESLLAITEGEEWRRAVSEFIANRNDGTAPRDGWPWPWNDSHTTDYAYAFEDESVFGAGYGGGWWSIGSEPDEEAEAEDRPPCVFPDMSKQKSVTAGRRSGLIVLGG